MRVTSVSYFGIFFCSLDSCFADISLVFILFFHYSFNAELMLSSFEGFWSDYALLDISSMTNGEVLSISAVPCIHIYLYFYFQPPSCYFELD